MNNETSQPLKSFTRKTATATLQWLLHTVSCEQAYFDKYVADCVKLCDFDLDIFDVFTITSNSNQKLKKTNK